MNHRSLNKVPKAKVLRSALGLFSSKGYSETKMVDIARDSGLSVGALYLRFKSKEELCLELIKDQTKDFVERIENIQGTDPVEAIRNYIALNLEYAFQKKQLLSMFFREHNLPFLHPIRKKFFRTQHKIICDILNDGINKRIFRSMDERDMASMIFASVRGAVLLKIIFGIGDTTKMSASLFKLITDGIREQSEKEDQVSLIE